MPDSLKSTIAKNLKLLRAARDLTQARLAERAGLSINYIAEIETRRKYPADEKFEALAAALGVEPWILIYPSQRLASWLNAEPTPDPAGVEALERFIPPLALNREVLMLLGEIARIYAPAERPKPDKPSR